MSVKHVEHRETDGRAKKLHLNSVNHLVLCCRQGRDSEMRRGDIWGLWKNARMAKQHKGRAALLSALLKVSWVEMAQFPHQVRSGGEGLWKRLPKKRGLVSVCVCWGYNPNNIVEHQIFSGWITSTKCIRNAVKSRQKNDTSQLFIQSSCLCLWGGLWSTLHPAVKAVFGFSTTDHPF